jgi:hypothetical protein
MLNREMAKLILNTKKDLLIPLNGKNDTFYVKVVKSDVAMLMMGAPDLECEFEIDNTYQHHMYMERI